MIKIGKRIARTGIVASTSAALKQALIVQPMCHGFFLGNEKFANINIAESNGTTLGDKHMTTLCPNMLEVMICKLV